MTKKKRKKSSKKLFSKSPILTVVCALSDYSHVDKVIAASKKEGAVFHDQLQIDANIQCEDNKMYFLHKNRQITIFLLED